MMISESPAAVSVPAAEDQADVIEVIGIRTDQNLKVDRRTYRVQSTPHAAQKDAIQLLRGLPAVTITPSDEIILLGADNVRIYVDGRPFTGNAKQYLRTLHGSDVERIEVITNPSAQFSSEGTAGIINFVLRKNEEDGSSGNAGFEVSSNGLISPDVTMKFKRGKFAYEFQAGGYLGELVSWTHERSRSFEPVGGGLSINNEFGERSYRGAVGRLSGKVTYDIDSNTSASAKLGGGGGQDELESDLKFIGLTDNFMSFTERRMLDSIASYGIAEFDVTHKGSREGELLGSSVQFYGTSTIRDTTNSFLSTGDAYRIERRKKLFSGDARVDWTYPLLSGQLVSLGVSWKIDKNSQSDSLSTGQTGSLTSISFDEFDARNTTLAGYATFQQDLGRLIFVPGIRVEASNRRISSPGFADVELNRTRVFPTLHLKYELGGRWDLTASYSKRIDRVPLEYVRPYDTVEDVVTVFQGNPQLKDQTTDSYEANLKYRNGQQEAGAILYIRDTSDFWSKTYSISSDRLNAYSYVNAGSSLDRGVQFDVSMPIMPQIRGTLSVNLFDQKRPVSTEFGLQNLSSFRFTTTGSLQWTGKTRGSLPADIAQVQWSYNSPARDFQYKNLAWFDANLSYTRGFNRKLSLTATFQIPRIVRNRLIAPTVDEYFRERRVPEFKIKLLQMIGK